MLFTEFNMETALRIRGEEEREVGREEGRVEGREVGIKEGREVGIEEANIDAVIVIIKKLHLSLKNAMDILELDDKHTHKIAEELYNQGIEFVIE